MFEKLYKYIGKSIKTLIDRPDEPYCLRLQKNRVFYVKEHLMRRATNVRETRRIAYVLLPDTVPMDTPTAHERPATLIITIITIIIIIIIIRTQ